MGNLQRSKMADDTATAAAAATADSSAAATTTEAPAPAAAAAKSTVQDTPLSKPLTKGLHIRVDCGDGNVQEGVIVKLPKHGRWVNVYVSANKKILKKVELTRLYNMLTHSSPGF